MYTKQYSFQELQKKRVVNLLNGIELGHCCDLIFSSCGKVQGIVVQIRRNFFKSLASSENLFIEWRQIYKIGADVILVKITQSTASVFQSDGFDECNSDQKEYQNYDSGLNAGYDLGPNSGCDGRIDAGYNEDQDNSDSDADFARKYAYDINKNSGNSKFENRYK